MGGDAQDAYGNAGEGADVIDWLDQLHEHARLGMGVLASGVIGVTQNDLLAAISKAIGVLIVTALIGVTAWATTNIIDLKTDVAALKVQNLEQDRRLAEGGDKWSRRDHDSYAAQIESRLNGVDQRLNAQRADLQDVLRKGR